MAPIAHRFNTSENTSVATRFARQQPNCERPLLQVIDLVRIIKSKFVYPVVCCRPFFLKSVLSVGALLVAMQGIAEEASLPAASASGTPATAARIDWRPRAALPAEIEKTLPAYCVGAYLPPLLRDTAVEAPQPDGEVPVFAKGADAYYEVDKLLRLQGDVHLRQGLFEIQGTHAVYDEQAGKMVLQGPVVSRGKGFLLTGEDAGYDVNSGVLDLNHATFLLHDGDMRGDARQLTRPRDNQIDIRQGHLTTCDPGNNAWSIIASEIHLDRDTGVGTATHIRLNVKDVPVFYFPWMNFPIDDRRKSGFLYPLIGNSNAGGLNLATPYYFNLAPHYDLTYTPNYVQGRGLVSEVETRYLSAYGETVFSAGYIKNDTFFADEFVNKDSERWAVELRNTSVFGGGWSSNLELPAVSDDDYIHDLKRTLAINNTTFLRREASVSYADESLLFDASLAGFQTVDAIILDRNKPYAQLPEINLAYQTDSGPIAFDLESQYTYFWRKKDGLSGLDKATGSRARAIPELALPMEAMWGYVRPAILLDYTQYALQDFDTSNDLFSRSVPFYQLDSGLYFDRDVSLFGNAFNQSLEPRLYYVYSPRRKQADIPSFDAVVKSFNFEELFARDRFSGGDRVGDNNRLTLAVTSRFNHADTGAEWARFSIGQIYFFEDREVSLFGAGVDDRSDSPIAGEMVLRPSDNLEVISRGLWDTQTYETVEGRSQLVYHSADYRYLANVGHTFSDNNLEQLDIGGIVPVNNNLSLIGRYAQDLVAKETAGSLFGVEYTTCCWSAQLIQQTFLTNDEELDHSILFQIQLKGLGGRGSALTRLDEALIGYRERDARLFHRLDDAGETINSRNY